ncbi:hypothetical protein [Nonomuraea phyllanthi]|uniref:hypothetical protein n=1 Tax=Nonomuraea phyllanthi TaxID=2219224 RepID=UPI001D141F3A|nr:hypothetical protein [Nonomuraea phyllanthi]
MYVQVLDAGRAQPYRELLDVLLRTAAVHPHVAQPEGVVARALRPGRRGTGKLDAERDGDEAGQRDHDGQGKREQAQAAADDGSGSHPGMSP